jgi:crotonobetaine/carnitine-CoA ligase
VGEFVIRPKHPFAFMAGYFRRPEETVKAWRNLWFHTGDAMRRDSDGNYYYVDRMKDCVRRRGENISTFEVEQVLIGHAGVREVAVIGIASPFNEGEQEIKALIVPADRTFDCEALYDFARQNLPHFALPRIIEVVGELPKTSTGKVSKTALRQTGMTPDCWVAADINQARRRA